MALARFARRSTTSIIDAFPLRTFSSSGRNWEDKRAISQIRGTIDEENELASSIIRRLKSPNKSKKMDEIVDTYDDAHYTKQSLAYINGFSDDESEIEKSLKELKREKEFDELINFINNHNKECKHLSDPEVAKQFILFINMMVDFLMRNGGKFTAKEKEKFAKHAGEKITKMII